MIRPDHIHAETLYALALVFFTVILVVIALTAIYLRVKKQRFRTRQAIQQLFDQWISEMLLEEHTSAGALQVPEALAAPLQKKINRQYAIDQLINTRKNLTGIASGNIIWLYRELGLREDSLRKFRSGAWQQKARGIYELYMMDQRDMQERIYRYTNSRDEYVRMEAQTAVLGFSGFEGLRFLDTLTRPLTAWQQVKLLEQLRPLDPGSMDHLPRWLQSPNRYVVLFALKLAEVYQQMQVNAEVVDCLQSPDEKIRRQAIQTLVRVADESTPAILIRQYQYETPGNRQTILQSLEHIAGEAELPFLHAQLEQDDMRVKLQAARTMARCCNEGLRQLQEKARAVPDPFEKIFLHIKSEMAR